MRIEVVAPAAARVSVAIARAKPVTGVRRGAATVCGSRTAAVTVRASAAFRRLVLRVVRP